MPKYGRIRWIDSYDKAPKSAVFILRKLGDGTPVLEKYDGFESSETLVEFDYGAMEEDEIFSTLEKCRNITKSSKTIWVQKPGWKR